MPTLFVTEYRTLFACYRPGDPESVLVAEFVGCSSARFGFPNEDVLNGHPLASSLEWYQTHTVIGSSWLRDLKRIESVHPLAHTHRLHQSGHYFLTFHDSCLEAIATDLVVRGDPFPTI